ncbi:MAG: AraC family transcriptional regulator [Paenibacillus sp.]|jgi:AraC-like DNA-binding protein/mannose-6-phosphate isomerase-like protein (cupin superfamily)|nr:AraC family transcriptional regulator [Paenibacillus sp.]
MALLSQDFNIVISTVGNVMYTPPDPGWTISYSNPKHHIVAYSLEGQAHYTIDGKDYLVRKGDFVFFPKGKFHSGVSDQRNPWASYVLLFDATFPNAESEQRFLAIDNIIPKSHVPQFTALFQDAYQEWTTKKTGYRLRCRCRIMEIFCLLIRKMDYFSRNERHEQAIDAILNFMADNVAKNVTIEELSTLAGYSPSHFQSVFKQITGKTAIQYHNEIKINKARDLLQYGNFNVTEAAMQVGFNDVYYFSKLFKRVMGYSPSQFLKKRLILDL